MGELTTLQQKLQLRSAHIDGNDLLHHWGCQRLSGKHRQHEGRLGIWGMIQRYVYHYAPDSALVLRIDCSVEKEVAPPVHQRANVGLRGKSLALNRESAAD